MESQCSGSNKREESEQFAPKDTLTVQNLYSLIPNIYKDNFTALITLGADEHGEVWIYSMDGRIMGRHSIGVGRNEINLSNDGLQAGVYLYKVYVNGQIKTNDKLVIVH